MKLVLIAAVAQNGVIGNRNRMIWHLPDDLKRFKKMTLSHALVMGRKTFESLGKSLPGRKNIVISKNHKYLAKDAIVACSLQEALEKARLLNVQKIFIAGGAQIYAASLNLCDELILTKVHAEFSGDALFPEIDESRWEKVSEKFHPRDAQHAQAFSFVNYRKKNIF